MLTFCFVIYNLSQLRAQSNLQGVCPDSASTYIFDNGDSSYVIFNLPLFIPLKQLSFLIVDYNWETFEKKTVYLPVETAFLSVEKSVDGGYLLAGGSNRETYSPYLLKLDKCLRIEWFVNNWQRHGQLNGVLSLPDSSIMVSPYVNTRLCDTISKNRFDYGGALVAQDGSNIGCYTYLLAPINKRDYYLSYYGIYKCGANTFLSAQRYYSDAFDTFAKINKDFSSIWNVQLNPKLGAKLTNIWSVDTCFYVLSNTYEQPVYFANYFPSINKITKSGKILWRKTYPFLQNSVPSLNVGNDLYLAGKGRNGLALLCKLDTSGIVKDSIYIDAADSSFVEMFEVKLSPKGKLLCITRSKNQNGESVFKIYRFNLDLNPANSVIYNAKAKEGACLYAAKNYFPKPSLINLPALPCKNDLLFCSLVNADTYKWYFNGQEIIGATQPSIQIQSTGTYSAELTKNGVKKSTQSIFVKVNPLPTPIISADPSATFCEYAKVNLFATSTFTKYQWWYKSQDINAATNIKYFPNTTGPFYLQVTDENGCKAFSNVLNVLVQKNPEQPNVRIYDSTLCTDNVVLYIFNYKADQQYQWKRNGVNINNATKAQLVVNDTLRYSVVTSNAASCTTISYFNSNVISASPVITLSGNILICDSALTYQWFKNGQKINAATQRTTMSSGLGSYTCQTTDRFGCIKTSNIIKISDDVGIAVLDQTRKTYPNPANQLFSIYKLPPESKVFLINVLGQVRELQATKSSNLQFDVSDVAAGFYFVKVISKYGDNINIPITVLH